MVGVDTKLSGLVHMPEMLLCFVHCQEFSVERTVFAFGGTEFRREEIERLPGAFDVLLQHGTDGEVRGILEDGEGASGFG